MDKERLTDARLAFRYSRPKMARLLGLQSNTLWRWEAGKADIGNPQMLRLAVERLQAMTPDEREAMFRELGTDWKSERDELTRELMGDE